MARELEPQWVVGLDPIFHALQGAKDFCFRGGGGSEAFGLLCGIRCEDRDFLRGDDARGQHVSHHAYIVGTAFEVGVKVKVVADPDQNRAQFGMSQE